MNTSDPAAKPATPPAWDRPPTMREIASYSVLYLIIDESLAGMKLAIREQSQEMLAEARRDLADAARILAALAEGDTDAATAANAAARARLGVTV